MAKIFVSFLGTGNGIYDEKYGYAELEYSIGEKRITSHFGQRVILEYNDASSFDRIHLLMTKESKKMHFDLLRDELLQIGMRPDALREDASITTQMSSEDQWRWFESLLEIIDNGDEVVFDFTHGFRSVPIIFSTAVGFLQRARKFTLLHAYYGYMVSKPEAEKKGTGEIVDMAPFYRINDWADGVARLTETADASKLAALAAEESTGGFAALNDRELIAALQDLTDIIKNIDVNRVADKAGMALDIIAAKLKDCSGADRQLLCMVQDKFADLAAQAPATGRYDAAYFQTQIILADMLLKHHLVMQAFTVMRECVASIGMLGMHEKYALGPDGKDVRLDTPRLFGEVFVTMCQFSRKKWKYTDEEKKKIIREKEMHAFLQLEKLYADLEPCGIIAKLRTFVGRMIECRNGFDHAWTSKPEGVPANVLQSGHQYLDELRLVIGILVSHGIIPTGPGVSGAVCSDKNAGCGGHAITS